MTEEKVTFAIFAALAASAVWFRWDMGLGEACRVVGLKISENKAGPGLQDAITPPSRANIALCLWAAILGVFVFLGVMFGIWTAAKGFAIFASVSVFVGVLFVPKPESSHYLKIIYGSMLNRHADFVRDNDTVRAEAIQGLIDRIELSYGKQILG